MERYVCRKGAENGPHAASYAELLDKACREVRDDGRTFIWLDDGTETAAICPDCGQGRVLWAEAGYVAWHRICTWCGSHWEEHPFRWWLVRLSSPAALEAVRGFPEIMDLVRAKVPYALIGLRGGVRALDPEQPVGLREGEEDWDAAEPSPRWKEVLAAAGPQHWLHAESQDNVARHGGLPALEGSWFRRARFYRR